MKKLDENTLKKISRIVEPYFKNKDSINYLIEDDIITIFSNIDNSEKLSDEIIEQITSALNGRFLDSTLVNQEYRYKFDLKPCSE